MVAATGDDEDNLVVSLLAKQEFGMPRVIARVNHPKNEWMFSENWGVDVFVSTPQLITAMVEEAVSVGKLVEILRFEHGLARLVEVTLAPDSPVIEQTIAQLAIPAKPRSSRCCARTTSSSHAARRSSRSATKCSRS